MKRSTIKRMILMTFVSGATLLQTTSCAQTAATEFGTLLSTIANQYIRSAVNDWLGTSTGLSSLMT